MPALGEEREDERYDQQQRNEHADGRRTLAEDEAQPVGEHREQREIDARQNNRAQGAAVRERRGGYDARKD